MIEEISKLKGIGMLHDSVPDRGLALSKAVAIYAENGRGKSAFAHFLRSLSDNDCTAVRARRALRQEDEPSAELLIDGATHTLTQDSWDRTFQRLRLFDDRFVEENVCTGDAVEPKQLERLLVFALSVEPAQTPEDIAAALDVCRDGINSRLRGLLAEFELATLELNDARATPQADFTLRLMGTEVPLAAEPAARSFSTTLSPAARRLLALALFFWALDDDPELPGKTVVLDDPARGLDRRRKTRLAEAVAGFAGRAQVIALSHDAEFIAMLRDRGFDQVLELRRSGVYCVFEDCDIDAILAEDYSDRPPSPGEFMAML